MDEAEAWVMQNSYNSETDRITLHMYPLIQCKDCRFKECTDRYGFIVCDITGEQHKKEWFCADGRSKEDAQTRL